MAEEPEYNAAKWDLPAGSLIITPPKPGAAEEIARQQGERLRQAGARRGVIDAVKRRLRAKKTG